MALRDTAKAIPTSELLDVVRANPKKYVEASLLLNGGYATHFLRFSGNRLYDEGIDGINRAVSIPVFTTQYANCQWIIDVIV